LKNSLEALFNLAEARGMPINKEVYEYINELTIHKKYFTNEGDLSRVAFYRFASDVMSHFRACNVT
jgi:hypothetical protein